MDLDEVPPPHKTTLVAPTATSETSEISEIGKDVEISETIKTIENSDPIETGVDVETSEPSETTKNLDPEQQFMAQWVDPKRPSFVDYSGASEKQYSTSY